MGSDASRPVFHGSSREPFVGVPAASVVPSGNRSAYGPLDGTDGLVFLHEEAGVQGRRVLGIPDNNRSVILPEFATTIGGRGYALSVKGVGARAPLYGSSPLDFAFKADFGPAPSVDQVRPMAGARLYTSEAWFGESPYGAQGPVPGSYSLRATELAEGCSINGFHICPVLELVEIPLDRLPGLSSRYWYRRYSGPYLQEHRLVPSNVRLYHQSEVTLGQNPAAVLREFGVATAERMDAFIDAYIASGVGALTVFVRTMRPCKWGVEGLDYENVWLDKDCLVAPDGTLHFADLEGMEWFVAGQDRTLEARVREQFNRNLYEVMYGLDALVREADRMAGRSPTPAERRAALVPRFEMALANDPFVRCEVSGSGLDLVVRPPPGGEADVPIRVIDLR